MLRAISQTVHYHDLFQPGQHWLVAVSGGADSVALAYALHHWKSRYPLTLTIIHLNHGIRGRAADEDARFVSELAWRLGLPCVQARADVPELARKKNISLEMAAREARYDFFAREAKALGAQGVVTAHTADDQVETVLLKLARGAGAQGLCGIPYKSAWHGTVLARPMRDVTHQDAIRFLKSHGLRWREDRTNNDLDFLRNRVRHEILPLLESRLNPRIRQSLLRISEVLREENAWFDRIARDLLQTCVAEDRFGVLKVDRLKGLLLAARRRVIRLWLLSNGVDPEAADFTSVERINRMIHSSKSSGKVPLAAGGAVVRSYRELAIEKKDGYEPPPFSLPLRMSGETILFDQGLRFVVRKARGFEKKAVEGVGVVPSEVMLDASAIGRSAVIVRSWRPGDRIKPLGMSGSRKIQDLFVDQKISRTRRPQIPLLECRGEIVWVAGYRPARGWEVKTKKSPSYRIQVGAI